MFNRSYSAESVENGEAAWTNHSQQNQQHFQHQQQQQQNQQQQELNSGPHVQQSQQQQQQRQNHGCHLSDGLRRIDYILVYRQNEDHHPQHPHNGLVAEKRREYYLEQVSREGVDLEIEEVHDSNETLTFVKVHCPWDTLCKWAHLLKMEMPLKIVDPESTAPKNPLTDIWHKLFSCYFCSAIGKENVDTHNCQISYPFDVKDLDKFQVDDKRTFFPDHYRNEIAWEILQHARNDPDDEKIRGVEFLVEEQTFEAAYPVHDATHILSGMSDERENDGQMLKRRWANWRAILFQQPLHTIRQYFGEKVGFYFVFMDYYTKMLIFPAMVGILVFFIGMVWAWNDEEIVDICDENRKPGMYWMCPICHPPYCEAWEMHKEGCKKYKWEFALDNEATLALSCIIMLWSILFLKFWRRREATMAAEWNTVKFTSRHSGMRPAYEIRATRLRSNPVTLQMEPHIPTYMRATWTGLSIAATFFILCLAGLCLAGLVVSRIALYAAFHKAGGHMKKNNIEGSRWFVHGLIFLMIAVFEGIYKQVVGKLTRMECPKTPHEFMNSLLWKLFVFELLIDFVPIGYAAWLKGRMVHTPLDLNWFTELCDAGCMSEVVELVFVLLFLRMIVGNFLEIAVPAFKTCLKRVKHNRHHMDHHNLPQWLKDYYLNEVELDGVYEDYMEMMVQFAFVVLFPAAFPLAAFICLINNLLEVRVDAIKVLTISRRPLSLRASGIHIWNRFMDIIVKLGVIFNAGLIAFTSDIVPRLYYGYNRAVSTSKHHQHTGYIDYSLSYINVKDWADEEKVEEMDHLNITQCYYPGYREPVWPYLHKHDYWRIMTIRLIAFSVYTIGFFIIMYLINSMISDVPSRVKRRIARHKHFIKQAFDAERRLAVRHSSTGNIGQYLIDTMKKGGGGRPSNASKLSVVVLAPQDGRDGTGQRSSASVYENSRL